MVFPNKFVMTIIRRKVSLLRNPAIKVLTVSNKPLYVSIPFISHKTNSDIKKELGKRIPEHDPQLRLRIILTENFSICSFFKFKDSFPAEMLSNFL